MTGVVLLLALAMTATTVVLARLLHNATTAFGRAYDEGFTTGRAWGVLAGIETAGVTDEGTTRQLTTRTTN